MTTAYRYDCIGNLLEQITSGARDVKFTYDSVGNLLEQATSGASEIAFSYAYNKNGYITGEVRKENGTSALRAFINYCFENGVNEIYTQTWSGNVRMLRCAEKLGSAECKRNIGAQEVNGQKYDGLTLRLSGGTL